MNPVYSGRMIPPDSDLAGLRCRQEQTIPDIRRWRSWSLYIGARSALVPPWLELDAGGASISATNAANLLPRMKLQRLCGLKTNEARRKRSDGGTIHPSSRKRYWISATLGS